MKKYYFSVVSIILLILSFIAFSDNLITDVHQESNSDPKFIIHGIFWFAWFLLFVIQSNFIRKSNYKAHQKLGIAGMFIAVGVVVSTCYIFVATFESWDALFFVAKANRFFMTSFAVLIVLAYRNRRKAASHKRFIYMATLLVLAPVIDRVSYNLYLNAYIFTPLIWNGLFISLFIYDWLTLKKIHKISWMGFVWFYIVWGISILI